MNGGSVNKDDATDTSVLDLRIEIPEGVVCREFAQQTVLLNLTTGQYHSLNPVGARFLDALRSAPDGRHAARHLAAEFDQELAKIEADLDAFCIQLRDRQLIMLKKLQ